MDSDYKMQARECCRVEYDRLVKRLDRCDLRSHNVDELHECYHAAAVKSRKSAQSCMISV